MSSDLTVTVKKYTRQEVSSLGKLLQLGEKDMVNASLRSQWKVCLAALLSNINSQMHQSYIPHHLTMSSQLNHRR
jgi:hypothetical protein